MTLLPAYADDSLETVCFYWTGMNISKEGEKYGLRPAKRHRGMTSRRTMATEGGKGGDVGDGENISGWGGGDSGEKGEGKTGSNMWPCDDMDVEEGEESKPMACDGNGRKRKPRSDHVRTEQHVPDIVRFNGARYSGQPVMKMRVDALRDALKTLGCSQDGRRPELRIRLARCLVGDSGKSTRTASSTGSVVDAEEIDRRSRGDESIAGGSGKLGMTSAELGSLVKRLSLAGVLVMDMKVVSLRTHLRDMGLKPRGRLKADLQRCLCEHLLVGQHGEERLKEKPSRGEASQPGEKGGTSADDVVGATAGSVSKVNGRRWAVAGGVQQGAPFQPPAVRKDMRWTKQTDTSGHPGLSTDCILFHGTPVSKMEPETMLEILEDLGVTSSQKGDEDIAQNLVELLVLRRAEAAEAIKSRQRWRGQSVSRMRKMELATALHHLGADESGKVEDMRSRFRRLLRKWAAQEIIVIESSSNGGVKSAAVGEASADARLRVSKQGGMDVRMSTQIASEADGIKTNARDRNGGRSPSRARDSNTTIVLDPRDKAWIGGKRPRENASSSIEPGRRRVRVESNHPTKARGKA